MRYHLKIVSLLCGMLTLFSACAAPSSGRGEASSSSVSSHEDGAMGRYIEEKLDLPEATQALLMHQLSDGSLELVGISLEGTGGLGLFRSEDNGSTWTRQETPDLSGYGALSETIAYDKEDNLYLMGTIYPEGFEEVIAEKEAAGKLLSGEDFPAPTIMKVSRDGSAQEILLQYHRYNGFVSYANAGIRSLQIAQNGDILINEDSCVRQYDASTGEEKFEYPSSSQIFEYTTYQNRLVMIDYNTEGNLQSFDLGNGSSSGTVSAGSVDESSRLAPGKEDSSLLLCDREGIRRLVEGGSIWEGLVEGELTSLGQPSLRIVQLLELSDGSFLVACRSGEGYTGFDTLLRYRYAEDVPTLPSQKLSVFSLRDNATIRQAMGVFQRENPDAYVDYHVALTGDSAITRSDALRSLNTELLAGKGPDVLVLDELPLDSYTEKGVLADLAALEPPLPIDELLPNPAAAFRQGEKLPAIPARIGVPAMWVPAGCPKDGTLSAFSSWYEQESASLPSNQKMLYSSSPEDLLATFYLSSLPAWKQEDGSLNREALANFLTEIKRIADSRQEEPAEPLPGEYNPLEMLSFSWVSGYLRVNAGVSLSFSEFGLPVSATQQVEKMQGGQFLPLPGQVQGVYLPQTILGINAHSDASALAAQFLQSVLSPEVQEKDVDDGYAIHAASFEKSWHNPYPEGEGMGSYGSTNGETGEIVRVDAMWPSEDYMQQQAERIASLSVPVLPDPALLETLQDETRSFFSGNKSAQEAADAVAERTQAYLNE